MSESWYEIFNTPRMLFYLAGLGIATLFWYRRCKRENIILDLAPIGIIAGVSIIVFLAVQQVGLTTQMKACNEEFTSVLQQRAELSDESDTLAGEEIQANSRWLKRLNNPPEEIAELHTTDPVYRAWVKGTITDFTVELSNIQNKRQQSLEERKAKTYPVPNCGQ